MNSNKRAHTEGQYQTVPHGTKFYRVPERNCCLGSEPNIVAVFLNLLFSNRSLVVLLTEVLFFHFLKKLSIVWVAPLQQREA